MNVDWSVDLQILQFILTFVRVILTVTCEFPLFWTVWKKTLGFLILWWWISFSSFSFPCWCSLHLFAFWIACFYMSRTTTGSEVANEQLVQLRDAKFKSWLQNKALKDKAFEVCSFLNNWWICYNICVLVFGKTWFRKSCGRKFSHWSCYCTLRGWQIDWRRRTAQAETKCWCWERWWE